MQAGDTDRVKQDGYWNVQCGHCGQWFDSKRSDATYCSSNCRMRASRAPQQMTNYIEYLGMIGRQAREKAAKHHKNKRLFNALIELRAHIDIALAQFEND